MDRMLSPDRQRPWRLMGLVAVILVFGLYDGIGASLAWAESRSAFYRVESLKGSVLVRGPYSFVWEGTKAGDKIPEGYLLQTLAGAKIKLRYKSNDGSALDRGGKITLTIDTPIVVRLDRDIMRRVAVSTNFVERLPSLSAEYSKLLQEELTLKTAWAKVTAAAQGGLSRESLWGLGRNKLEDKNGVESSTQSKRIHLITPYLNQKFVADNLPKEIIVKWKPAESKQIIYGVHIWRDSPKRPPAAIFTRANHYNLSIAQPGKYQIQVTSKNGVWQSDVYSFELVMGAGGMAGSQGGSGSLGGDQGLELLYPRESFEVLSSEAKVVDFFRWEPISPSGSWAYVWVLLDNKGTEIRRVQTKDTILRQELVPGEYLWYVQATGKKPVELPSHFGRGDPAGQLSRLTQAQDQVLAFKSKTRFLKVIQTSGAVDQQKRLSEFVRSGSQGAIYLSEGL